MSVPAGDLHRASERVQRALIMSTGFGGMVFGYLLSGKIASQWSELAPWFAFAAFVVAVVIPVSLTILAWTLPLRILLAIAAGTAGAFVLLQLLWVPAMTADHLVGMEAPWMQGINAAPSLLAAVAIRHRLVWVYALAQGPIVTVVRYLAVGDEWRASLLDGLGAVVFCTILVVTALALISAARQQDLLAARARAQASIEAARRTREREQARINGIVHDDIMSVLLVASRDPHASRLAEQADAALASIATLTIDPAEAPPYTSVDAVTALRSAVTGVASQVEFWHSIDGSLEVPSEVVEAMTEALAEAVRNSLLHAGPADAAIHRLVQVRVVDNAIQVTMRDTGRGFNTRGVNDRRLGLRVSIIERMTLLDGGSASIESGVGHGTTVTLTWTRP